LHVVEGESEPRHPAAWLGTIACNECWARIQERMREPLTAGPAALWSAIRELPAQHEALLLREFSGLSHEELAEALAVSMSAVESLLFRACRQLQVRMRPVFASLNSLAGGGLSGG
jgi:DNA-directed RNA polymerase specialized sigma24 family protein